MHWGNIKENEKYIENGLQDPYVKMIDKSKREPISVSFHTMMQWERE